jgi:hypothetical protein
LGTQGRIFISYRRGDVPGDARSVCGQLERAFGKTRVFMDVDRLLAGQRFERELEKALSQSDVLIAIIGSRWMELLAEHARVGTRDFVHDEVAAALKRDIVLIPVLIGREDEMPPLPRKEDLPEEIRDLVQYQKHNIRHETFGDDATRLIEVIKTLLRDKHSPRPWRAMATAAVGVIGLVLALGWVGDWTGVMSRRQPGVSQPSLHTSEVTKAGVGSSKAEEDTARKAEFDAKAARDEAARKSEEAKRQAEEESRQRDADAAKKKSEEAVSKKAAVDCDRLAADPMDSDRPPGVVGVYSFNLDASAATTACNDAMRLNSDTRFVYQAGRASAARNDYGQAMSLYRVASDRASAASMNRIGELYRDGQGVAMDPAQAANWFQKGAALDNSDAMVNLAVLFEKGQGVALSPTEASKWYEKAAARGNRNAMYKLGTSFRDGTIVTQDYAEAREWFEKAAALGDSGAMYELGDLYLYGRGVDRSYA